MQQRASQQRNNNSANRAHINVIAKQTSVEIRNRELKHEFGRTVSIMKEENCAIELLTPQAETAMSNESCQQGELTIQMDHEEQPSRNAKETMVKFCRTAKFYVLWIALAVFTSLSIVCSGFSVDKHSFALLIATGVAALIALKKLAKRTSVRLRIFTKCEKWDKLMSFCSRHERALRWFAATVSSLVALAVVVLVAVQEPANLVSLAGIGSLIFISFILSNARSNIDWQMVLTGMNAQFFFAALLMRYPQFRAVASYLGDAVEYFLECSTHGAAAVFGDNLSSRPLIFIMMPAVIFFGAVTAMLYHCGIAQFAIRKLAGGIQLVMGISAAESVAATCNIFMGFSETLMMIQPVLTEATVSEISAILTSGFATVSVAAMAGYLAMGIEPEHLIAASFMSAPAAFAVSKIIVPETSQSSITEQYMRSMTTGLYSNSIHALSCGAVASVEIVVNIVVNVLTFTASRRVVDGLLLFVGNRLCIQQPITFKLICSYLFWPLAFAMGVEWGDCSQVAGLLGTKIFLNEFVAFQDLGILKQTRLQHEQRFLNLTNSTYSSNTSIFQVATTNNSEFLSIRSETIATYALCGFSNICCLGICIGAFSALAPTRKDMVAKLALKCLLAGNIACFLTAATAGLLYSATQSF